MGQQQQAVCTQPVLLCMYKKRDYCARIYLVNACMQHGGSADRVKNRFVHENLLVCRRLNINNFDAIKGVILNLLSNLHT